LKKHTITRPNRANANHTFVLWRRNKPPRNILRSGITILSTARRAAMHEEKMRHADFALKWPNGQYAKV